MLDKDHEMALRWYVRTMSNVLTGQPVEKWEGGDRNLSPSTVKKLGGIAAKTDHNSKFTCPQSQVLNYLIGETVFQDYVKASTSFEVQNKLLYAFCRLLLQKTNEGDCGIVMAPSKKETSAMKKYWIGGKDDSGLRADFKDLCRCTIVCYNRDKYEDIPRLVDEELHNRCYNNRWTINKQKNGALGKIRIRNDEDDDLGYTDTNMSLILPNMAKVEVQVNVQATLYGKMGRTAFIQQACPPGLGESQYNELEKKKRVPGGCGHVLYIVWKDHSDSNCPNMKKDVVQKLSRDYWDHLSGVRPSNPNDIVADLKKLSESEVWIETFKHTMTNDPDNVPAFNPGQTWHVGDRVFAGLKPAKPARTDFHHFNAIETRPRR
jgi:hypothetical protein